MSPAFLILALLAVAGAVAAVGLRNLIHCALALAVALAAIAGVYLHLGAEFIAFAQLLVYLGAVAILILFAILLTRGSERSGSGIFSAGWGWGLGVALGLLATVAGVFVSARFPRAAAAVSAAPAGARELGTDLMTRHILALELIGLLLTAALIGAVILALHERGREAAPGEGR